MAGLKLSFSSSRTATHILVLCFLLIYVHVHHGTAVSFRHDSFSSDDFRAEDDATVTAGKIKLLGDNAGACRARGRVLYRQAVQLWDGDTGEAAGFTASFHFSIQSLPGWSSTPGYGMAFFLAPYTRFDEMPQESYNGCLGLFDDSLVHRNGATTFLANASGGARFVAVEFDTHQDAWDPSSRHIGVDVSSVDSGDNYEILPDGSLVDAGVMSATVNYDNATTRLDVVLNVSGTTYTLAATLDLRSLLPEQVSVGFSAATGIVRVWQQPHGALVLLPLHAADQERHVPRIYCLVNQESHRRTQCRDCLRRRRFGATARRHYGDAAPPREQEKRATRRQRYTCRRYDPGLPRHRQ